MTTSTSSSRGNRRGFIATAVAVACILSGAGLIGVSVASQRRVSQLPLASDVSVPDPRVAQVRPAPMAPATVGPILARSEPVALNIPSIGVHSAVQALGQATDGSLETPAPGPHYSEAAWYRYSPTPGSLGPAILLGHVDSASNGPSVFFRLGELKAGDRVIVARADDSVAVFEVDEVRRYSKADFPTDTVYSDINHAGLRILTCGGAFDDASGHYLDNIVVFASLVGSR